MNRPLVALMVVLAACKKDGPPAPSLPASASQPAAERLAQIDVDAGTVIIAAAGDISEAELGAQVATADLVADGGYDAVLLLGDDQYPAGALADYQKFFEPTWGRFMPITHPSPGNHEYKTADARGYFEYFGARAGEAGKGWYSFDLGAWHLISLNSSNGCQNVKCDASSEQLKWLKADLIAHRNKCTLAYFHHPRFSSGLRHGNFEGASAFWKVLYDYDADLVLNGHEHLYERFDPQDPEGHPDPQRGIREIIIGTGGADAYELGPVKPNSTARHSGTYGILKVKLNPGSYDWEFVPVTSGQFVESGTTLCH